MCFVYRVIVHPSLCFFLCVLQTRTNTTKHEKYRDTYKHTKKTHKLTESIQIHTKRKKNQRHTHTYIYTKKECIQKQTHTTYFFFIIQKQLMHKHQKQIKKTQHTQTCTFKGKGVFFYHSISRKLTGKR